ncbi:MAG: TlpA disulfide reductase family protein [Acidimicrobiia bacterium]
MLPFTAALVITLIGAVTFWVVSRDDSGPGASNCAARVVPEGELVAVGRDAPRFVLPELAGGCFHSASVHGRPLIVNFWASWCRPCRTEFPLFEEARTSYGDEGLEVIGVNVQDITSDARQFADARGAEWPLVLDEDEVVADAFGVRSVPETFFIAADGTVVSHVFGLTSKRDLNREIARLFDR